MVRYRSICALFFVAALVPGACFAGTYRSYDEMNAVAIVISDHSNATFAGARAIVESAGAYGVQMFPPNAIFGYFPARPSPSQFAGLDVALCFARGDLMGKGLDGIVRRVVGDLFDQEKLLQAGPLEETGPIEDRMLRVPEEIVRATTPVRNGPCRVSPTELADRSIRENSEFLVGSVLVNVIFPESMGSSENWTDDEISGAISGIALGISQYMQRALWFADLSFIYNYSNFERVPVTMEPIESNMDIDYIWMGEALSNLGYPGGDIVGAHSLNNATRNTFKTDWVFTAFIADMSDHYDADPPSPDPGCWGGHGYVAYSWLGGPYLLVPYPACRYGYGLGFGRVFIHEMSHTFWALDEYASAGEGCGSKSGYLAVSNRNTLFQSCQETVPCIMQTASPPFAEPQPICDYTQGQVGIGWVEWNATTYLKIFAIPPKVTITSIPGALDTLLPGEEYFISIDVRNDAVPNLNPMQAEPPDRVDYAPYIKGGWISINEQGWQLESPTDGKWGHSAHEQIAKEISTELVPGLNTIDFRAENRIGLCDTASKNLFLIGLKFNSVYAIPSGSGMRVAWTTAVELFGAVFDVMRSDLTTGEAETRIATVSTPDAIGNRRAYSCVDTTVQATHRYRYRLDGRFSIAFRGEIHDYSFSSQDVSATANIPIEKGIVSNLLPNPTRGSVQFTVNVPRTFGNASASRVAAEGTGGSSSNASFGEVRTRVEIGVYNVLGQRVRSVYANSVFSGFLTLAWDGTDSYHKAVPAGIYFLRVVAGGRTEVRKIVILR
jgi:hypothetical protein